MNDAKKKFWTPLRITIAIVIFCLSVWTLQFVGHLESIISRDRSSRNRGIGHITEHTPNPFTAKVREPAANLSIKTKKGEKVCGLVGCTIRASCIIQNSGDKDAVVEVTLNVYDQGSTFSESKKIIADMRTAKLVDFEFHRRVSDGAKFGCEYKER